MRKILYIITILFTLPALVGFFPAGHGWVTYEAFQKFPSSMRSFAERFEEPVINGFMYMYPDVLGPYPHGNDTKLGIEMQMNYDLLVQALERGDAGAADGYIGYIAHYAADACSPTQTAPEAQGQIDDFYDGVVDMYIEEVSVFVYIDGPRYIGDVRSYTEARCKESRALYLEVLMDTFFGYSDNVDAVWVITAPIFNERLNRALVDFRDLMYSVWVDAGKPAHYPPSNGCHNPLQVTQSQWFGLQ